ncbi:MAG: alpha/beta fold hydrolase, partial [Acidobacteria bacterium]|nr:alpha/beta fold hydrolase [Acidobacteriota bacterium]
MTAITATRNGSDGVVLATRHWSVPSPRAAIVLVHGVAEHLGRYEHIGAALTDSGFDVRGTDLRGFGRSGGRRAYVENFSQYSTDLIDDIAAAAELGVPVVLLGHSMGGLIASLYAVSNHPQPDLLVLSAPAIDAAL